MGKETLHIDGEDVSDEYDFPRHDDGIYNQHYTYEEVQELIIEYPWLCKPLTYYLDNGFENLTHREFYAKIEVKDKYLIRFPIIIDNHIKHEYLSKDNSSLCGDDDWTEDDSDYEEDDASDITDAENIQERLQLYALRILKPIKITNPSTLEEINVTIDNITTFSYDVLNLFTIQHGFIYSSENALKRYFEEQVNIRGYLENELSNIFPSKSISELSEQQLKNGIFYIQMRQLESFTERYGEDGKYYKDIQIYYGD
jgi:hypothetical protein